MFTVKYANAYPFFPNSYIFSTTPSHLYVSLFFDNLLSPVTASHVCIGGGHPVEHGKPNKGYNLKITIILPAPAIIHCQVGEVGDHLCWDCDCLSPM